MRNFSNLKNSEYTRLKNILLLDKLASPSRVSEVLRNDILSTLSSYLTVDSESLTISVDSEENGISVNIYCRAKV